MMDIRFVGLSLKYRLKNGLIFEKQVDLKHKQQPEESPDIEMGMDLSAFYLSVEWDIMAVPAKRKEKFYRYFIFKVDNSSN